MHHGKKPSQERQCDAVAGVLLSSMLDAYPGIVADRVHPVKETVFPDGCGLSAGL